MLFVQQPFRIELAWLASAKIRSVNMEVLGKKESQVGGNTVVSDITAWTLLGLVVDNFFKIWARQGSAAIADSEVRKRGQIKVCHVVKKNTQSWASPGVDRFFRVTEGALSLSQRLVGEIWQQLHSRGWRVFGGDYDLKTSGGQRKGAVDGVADNLQSNGFLALIEIKVRRRKESNTLETDAAALASELDAKWNKYTVPQLKTPWTHGILITLYQVNPCRSYSADFTRFVLWPRGAPPQQPSDLTLPAQAPRVIPTAQPEGVIKRPRKTLPSWSEIKDNLEYGTIERKVAVKVNSYLREIHSEQSAQKSLNLWQRHFSWSDDVFIDQGGAQQNDARHGGSEAKFLLLSCIKEVHRAKLAGSL